MKKYQFKFTKLILTFIYLGLALAVVAFAVNTYFIIADGIGDGNTAYAIIRYVLMYFVAVLLFVVLLSMLLSSYYSIDKKTLITSFGIIKSKYEISKIDSVLLDRTTEKLSIGFEDKSFIMIAVREEWFDDFIDELLKVKPEIEFSIKSRENDIDENGKKS